MTGLSHILGLAAKSLEQLSSAPHISFFIRLSIMFPYQWQKHEKRQTNHSSIFQVCDLNLSPGYVLLLICYSTFLKLLAKFVHIVLYYSFNASTIYSNDLSFTPDDHDLYFLFILIVLLYFLINCINHFKEPILSLFSCCLSLVVCPFSISLTFILMLV